MNEYLIKALAKALIQDQFPTEASRPYDEGRCIHSMSFCTYTDYRKDGSTVEIAKIEIHEQWQRWHASYATRAANETKPDISVSMYGHDDSCVHVTLTTRNEDERMEFKYTCIPYKQDLIELLQERGVPMDEWSDQTPIREMWELVAQFCL